MTINRDLQDVTNVTKTEINDIDYKDVIHEDVTNVTENEIDEFIN